MKFIIAIIILPILLFAQHDTPVPSVCEPLVNYDVINYDIRINTIETAYPSNIYITINPLNSINSIILDCVRLNILSCTINGDTTCTFTIDANSLIINLPHLYQYNETFTIHIYYTIPSGSALYNVNNRYGNRILYSLGFASTARTYFPCVDHPLDKATFDITVITSSSNIVASNGTLMDEGSMGDNYFYYWRENLPMATYLFVIHSFPYIKWNLESPNGISIELYFYRQDSSRVMIDFGRLPLKVDYFDSLFGPYPFEKVGYAEAPVFGGYGAMENQSMISFGDRLIDGIRTYETVIAHELSHQWFGDAITPADWRDFWLNEGFGQYSEVLFVERFYSLEQGRQYIKDIQYQFLRHEWEEGRFPIYDPEEYLGYTVYYKGACVLHSLRYVVGDSIFFESLRQYYDRFKYHNVTTDSFRVVCENVSGIDLNWFFNEWIYEQGYPEIEYYFRNMGDRCFVYIRQKQMDAPIFTMPVDIALIGISGTYKERVVINDTLNVFEFNPGYEITSVEIDPESWILMVKTPVTNIDENKNIPDMFELVSYPNPFNLELNIKLKIPIKGDYIISIYDIVGKCVNTIELNELNIGMHNIKWDGKDKNKTILPSGIYIVKLNGNDVNLNQKVLLLK